MKNKIIKTLTVGLGCLMLALPLSSGVLNHNLTKVHVDEDSPYGMIQSKHIIHIDEDSPYGMIQSKHIIHIAQDMPTL